VLPGEPVEVAGNVIPGGLVYVGRRLPTASGAAEPALINADLPIAASPGRYFVPSGGPELAYHLLSPVARRAYLDWLSGGRRTDVAAGLVLLFCFGLERRILLDGDAETAVHDELPTLLGECRRLRIRYAADAVLRAALDRLLDLLELLTARPEAPGTTEPERVTPLTVRIGLARFAASSTPLPASVARAWLNSHPSSHPRRSERDCPTEFAELFTRRYRDRFGDGVIPADGGAGIRLRYRPTSPELSAVLVCRPDLPDLLAEPGSVQEIARLRDEVAVTLDPYRRWLARFPQARDSLAAVSLLPPELTDSRRGRLGAVRVWSERRLDGRSQSLIDAGDLWRFWAVAAPERMTAEEAAALLTLLARLGVGIEPDVRFGAPPLTPGPAVLFRLGVPAGTRPGPRFASAAVIARCAAAVAVAAGPVDPSGTTGATLLATAADLAAALRLAPGEDLRLAARLGWLLTTRVDIDRLGRHRGTLTPAEREIAGHYLVTVAVTADPVMGPATVAVLTRLYRIVGLDPESVFPRLHERGTGTTPALPRLTLPVAAVSGQRTETADDPVLIQSDAGRPNGFALPWAAPAGPAATGVRLDQHLVTRKVAESDAAAALLHDIFGAEEQDSPQPSVDPVVPGLDRSHGALLRDLAGRPSWTRAEFEALAAAHGLLPDGALDELNEVAIDTAGAPVAEGDATLDIADDVLRELLA
jgi:hypothetical protein